MPDIAIDGTNVTLSFPDSMKPDQISAALAQHPLVQQIRGQAQHDALLAPRDPGFEQQVQQYTQTYLQPGDKSAPSLLAQSLASVPAPNRLNFGQPGSRLTDYSSDVGRAAVLRRAVSLSDPIYNHPGVTAGQRAASTAASMGIPSAVGPTPGGKTGLVPANVSRGQSVQQFQQGQNRQDQAQVEQLQRDQDARMRAQMLAEDRASAMGAGLGAPPTLTPAQAAAVPQLPAKTRQYNAAQAQSTQQIQALGGDRLSQGRQAYRLLSHPLESPADRQDRLLNQPGSAIDAAVPGFDKALADTHGFYGGVARIAAAGLEPESAAAMLLAGPAGEALGVPRLIHGYFMSQAALGTAHAAMNTDLYKQDKGQYWGELLANATQAATPLLLKAATDANTAKQFAQGFNDAGGEIFLPDMKSVNLAYRGLKKGGQTALFQRLPEGKGFRLYSANRGATPADATAPGQAQPATPNAPTGQLPDGSAGQANGGSSPSPDVSTGQSPNTPSGDSANVPLPQSPFQATHEIVTRGERVPVQVTQDPGGPMVRAVRENGQPLTVPRGQLRPLADTQTPTAGARVSPNTQPATPNTEAANPPASDPAAQLAAEREQVRQQIAQRAQARAQPPAEATFGNSGNSGNPTAPVEAAAPRPGFGIGREGTAYTSQNTPVPFRYELREGRDLVTSHTDSMQPNPHYDQALQPRDRSRVASEAQVSEIATNLNPPRLGLSASTADGAPIIGSDGQVESGNGRTLGIQRAYARNLPGADAYRQFLKTSAGETGIDPAHVDQMQNPVLVRTRMGDVTPEQRANLADEMGRSGVSGLSDVETARGDAAKLRSSGLLGQFAPDESGNITSQANLPFVRGFLEHVAPAERNALIQPDGSLSATGVRRIKAAVLASAYDNTHILGRMLESTDDNTRNVGTALLNVAPKFAALKEGASQGTRFPLDITGDVTDAANTLSHLRDRGVSVETYQAQTGMFGQELSPVGHELLSVMDRYKRSGAKLGKVLHTYADIADAAGDPHQQALFGDEPPTPLETLHAALKLNGDEHATVTADHAAALSRRAQPGESRASQQSGAGEARPQRTETNASAPGEVRSGATPADRSARAAPSSETVTSPAPSATPGERPALNRASPPTTASETSAGRDSALGERTSHPAPLDLDNARSPRDVKQQLNERAQAKTGDKTAPATAREVVSAAQELGLSASQLRQAAGTNEPVAYARAVRETLQAHRADVEQAAQAYKDAPTPDNLNRLEQARQGYQTVLHTARGAAGEASQALQQYRLLSETAKQSGRDTTAGEVFSPAPEGAAPGSKEWGSQNTLVTTDAADAARARLRKNLGQLNSGLDPELLKDAFTLGLYHFEAGLRSFTQWAGQMEKEVPGLSDGDLQHVWANLKADAQTRQATLQVSDVFVDKLAGRLGRQGAQEFVNALQGEDGSTSTLDALLTGKPLTADEQQTMAQAYLDNLPARSKAAPTSGPMQTLADVVAQARQASRNAAQANKPALTDAQVFTRYVTRALGSKASADQFFAQVPADVITDLLAGKTLPPDQSQSLADAFRQAQKPKAAPAQLTGASKALSDIVQDARTQAKQQAQAAHKAAQQATGGAGNGKAPPAPLTAPEAVTKRLSGLDADTATRFANDLANLRKDDYAGMNALVRRYSSMATLDKISTARKAGLLSGVRTIGKIALAHGSFLAAEEASRLPASLADMALSAMTGNDRTVQGVSLASMQQAARTAATRGVKEARTIFQGGEGALTLEHLEHGVSDAHAQMGGSFDRAPVEFSSGNRLLDGYVNGVFRIHGSMYHVMKTYALSRALMEQADLGARSEAAHLKATGQPVPSDYVTNRRAQLLNNPSDTMTANAISAAEEATFINDNPAAALVSGARQSTQKYGTAGAAIRFGMDMAIPFPRVPSNVVARLIDYTGVSAGVESVKAARSVLTKAGVTPEQQHRLAVTFGRGSVGAGIIALGYLLASRGQATGTLENQDERKENETNGVKPGSLMVNGKWRQTDDISPVGALFSAGATLHQIGVAKQAEQDKLDEKGSDKQAKPRVGEALFHLLHEQPLVSGLANLGDLKDGKQYAVGGMAGSFVPTLISDIAGQMDPLVRQKDTWGDYVTNRVPGLRSRLPAKVDANGQGLPQGNTLLDFLNSRDPKNLDLSPDEQQKVDARQDKKDAEKEAAGGRSHSLFGKGATGGRSGGSRGGLFSHSRK